MSYVLPAELAGLSVEELGAHLTNMRALPAEVDNRASLIASAERALDAAVALEAAFAVRENALGKTTA